MVRSLSQYEMEPSLRTPMRSQGRGQVLPEEQIQPHVWHNFFRQASCIVPVGIHPTCLRVHCKHGGSRTAATLRVRVQPTPRSLGLCTPTPMKHPLCFQSGLHAHHRGTVLRCQLQGSQSKWNAQCQFMALAYVAEASQEVFEIGDKHGILVSDGSEWYLMRPMAWILTAVGFFRQSMAVSSRGVQHQRRLCYHANSVECSECFDRHRESFSPR